MTNRVKIIVSILVAVIVLAGILVAFNSKNMKSSADVLVKKTTFTSLKHHVKNPFNNLKHHVKTTFDNLKHHHNGQAKWVVLSGQVVDSSNQKPISGIKVLSYKGNSVVPSSETTTDKNGNYSFNLQPHVYQLKLSERDANGYIDLITNKYNTKTVSDINLQYLPISKNISMDPVVNYIINAKSSVGGTISPAGDVSIRSGSNKFFIFTPNVGYKLDYITVDGIVTNLNYNGRYLFTKVDAKHIISATFVAEKYTINATVSAGGSISPSATVNVTPGTDQIFSFKPDAGYKLDYITVDGVVTKLNSGSNYVFTKVNAKHTIFASFMAVKYTINATAGVGGSITPTGASIVAVGKSQGFTITPKAGYQISDVLVNNISKGAVASYTFSNVIANNTIKAVFIPTNGIILGKVTSGGRPFVSGAVYLTNLSTKAVINTVTDTTGSYKFQGLANGVYEVNTTARICTRYWFWTSCSNRFYKQNVTVSSGKTVDAVTVRF